MLRERRHEQILSALSQNGVVATRELCAMMPEVSHVTIRRDIAALAESGELRRTYGGATLPRRSGRSASPSAAHDDSEAPARPLFEALILPPVDGRGAEALRKRATRAATPFLAESAPQEGGAYLGPDNRAAGHELGLLAGARLSGRTSEARALLVCLNRLVNTRQRAEGFERGLREAFAGNLSILRVNGQGTYRAALRSCLDALDAHEAVDLVFGINDHSTLAAMEAAERRGRPVLVYGVGGESVEFVRRVADGGPLQAVAALFPEVVGARAIDAVARALAGHGLPPAVTTPHQIITAKTLGEIYEPSPQGWRMISEVRDALVAATAHTQALRVAGTVGFVSHYPAHDWYRTLEQAMRLRCERYGLSLAVTSPGERIAGELTLLRSAIARAAADRIAPGQTVIVGEGEAGLLLAGEIAARAAAGAARIAGVTVITNALDVLERLSGAPGVKVIVTGGELQAADRCLVGPSLGSLFEVMRADIAFLSVAGVSARFGISARDERLALAAVRFMRAARETVALADHTLLGADAHHRVAPLDAVVEIVTDDGSLPLERLALREAGAEVTVASDDEAIEEDGPVEGP